VTVSSVLVTGANAGIGQELARQLGQRDDIDVVCRPAPVNKAIR
jgi:NAD(P)-dependent dehydrogenase (short-subunit alcohol dehydrogenase family)